jgi:hypothetical protein
LFVRHLILSLTLGTVLAGSADPFAWLGPTIQISQADRDQLDQRQVVVKILPAAAQELAVVAAGSINADASTLIASVHRVADLKRSRYVPQIHRLSPQPNVGDFGELTLDDVDLREIGKCRPTDCDLKLSADEIARLQAASGPTGNARAAVDEEFRRVLVQRAERYMTAGQQAGRSEFSALLQNSHYIARHMSELAGHL